MSIASKVMHLGLRDSSPHEFAGGGLRWLESPGQADQTSYEVKHA